MTISGSEELLVDLVRKIVGSLKKRGYSQSYGSKLLIYPEQMPC